MQKMLLCLLISLLPGCFATNNLCSRLELLTPFAVIITAIATFYMAKTTSLTVSEMKKQREMTYRPDVIPFPDINFITESVKNHIENINIEDIIDLKWIEKPSSLSFEEYPSEKKQPKEIDIPIFNVGFGPAKNVEMAWEFEIYNVIEKVNKLIREDDIYLEFEDGCINKITKKTKNLLGIIGEYVKNQRKIKKNFTLPASINLKQITIKFPSEYRLLINIILFFSFKKDPESEPKLPKITLIIKYTDIGGGKHEAKYVCSTSISKFPIITKCNGASYLEEWSGIEGVFALQSTHEHDLYRSETES